VFECWCIWNARVTCSTIFGTLQECFIPNTFSSNLFSTITQNIDRPSKRKSPKFFKIVINKKICCVRHSWHTRPKMCTFWSLFEVNLTILRDVQTHRPTRNAPKKQYPPATNIEGRVTKTQSILDDAIYEWRTTLCVDKKGSSWTLAAIFRSWFSSCAVGLLT